MKYAGVVAVAGLAILAGCGGLEDVPPAPTPTPSAHKNVAGSLDLSGYGNVFNIDDKNCTGMGGYDDIAPSAQVSVLNGKGEVLAFTSLGAGSFNDGVCTFTFQFDSIPAGENVYMVKLGHRDGPNFHDSDLDDGISLTLGP